MYDVLKVLFIFALILILVNRKLNLGLAMIAGSLGLALLYRLSLADMGKVLFTTVTGYTGIQMILALGLIMVMENILRKTETFSEMMGALKHVVRDIRIVLAAPPAIIGMVPSIGGAYFSAPLVEEASSAISISAERKGFINYWFRHIWEYILPTYPGIILASALTGFPLDRLIVYHLPFSIMVILTGTLFCFRGIGLTSNTGLMPKRRDYILKLITSLLPIGAVLLFVGVFRIDIAITMGIVIVSLFIYHRYSPGRIVDTFRESISWNVFLIIAGIIFFKEMLDATGSVNSISLFFKGSGFPLIILFFILPFLVGMLTGLTIAFVGATFPLLITMSGGSPDIGHMAFAFASGFTGVMFSPVHMCFVLTGEYFSADKGTIYRYMIIPSSIIMLTAAVMWVAV
ncbi:MAG: DUF401 family protein [Nitrospirae bacterium]|nr:DUF401 family protein [Nitrospirota bacterium]